VSGPDRLDELMVAVQTIAGGKRHDLEYDLQVLRAWRELVISGLEIEDGGRAAIDVLFPPIPKSSGWYHYRECLRPWQTGVVEEIAINPDTLVVSAMFIPDTQWTVHDHGSELRRYPAEGGTFSIAPKYLRLPTSADLPLPMPAQIASAEETP